MNKAECLFEKNGYAKTHGELTLEGLKKLIGKIKTKNKVFVDMGSGNGSVVINMVKTYLDIKKVIGIELNKERYDYSVERVKKELTKSQQKKVELIYGDFFGDDIDYKKVDFVYISNLCFGDIINKKIAIKLNKELYQVAKDEDFSEICITSESNVIQDEQTEKEIEVTTKKATGNKCSLCWKVKSKKCERENCKIL